MFKIPKLPKLNIPKQLFARNPMQRPTTPQPQPQPAMGLSGMGMFGNFKPLMQNPNAQQMPIASQGGYPGPIPQSTPMSDADAASMAASFDKIRADAAALPKMTGGFGGGFGQPIARAQPAMGLSGMGMFNNFRPLMQNFNAQQMPIAGQGGFFGNPFIRAQQTPQPTTGLSGLGTLSPEQINQLRNSIQTLPANINQELAKMSPGGMQQTAQNGLFGLGPQNPMQTPPPSPQDIQNTMSTNFAAGMTPGMGFPAAPVQGASAPPTGGLSSLGFA